jgi:hypothetical protein
LVPGEPEMVVVLEAFEARVTLLWTLEERCSCEGLRFVETWRVMEFWACWRGVRPPCWMTLRGEELAEKLVVFRGEDESRLLDVDLPLEWLE